MLNLDIMLRKCCSVFWQKATLSFLLPVFIACNARDGQQFTSESIKESKANGLFIQRYETDKWAIGEVPVEMTEAWLEHACIYKGWDKVKTSGYILTIRFADSLKGKRYLDGGANARPERKMPVLRIHESEHPVGESGATLMDAFFTDKPTSSSIMVYLHEDFEETSTVLDSARLRLVQE